METSYEERLDNSDKAVIGLPCSHSSARSGDMSLGIVFKGPEGVVLAADSRVTLNSRLQGQSVTIPAYFDNATKLLEVAGQHFVGVVTYGLGAIGEQEPRTAYSFMPEFERELQRSDVQRLPVEDFSRRLSQFFLSQWRKMMPEKWSGPDMTFLVGGYDEDAPYGRVFEVIIPARPDPRELHENDFGPVWGGQKEYTSRLIHGFDPGLPSLLKECLQLDDTEYEQTVKHLRSSLSLSIPYQFLPLQDCVDFAIFLVRTTIMLQTFTVGMRGVGGAVDVAIITRTGGFRAIQQNTILGEERTRVV